MSGKEGSPEPVQRRDQCHQEKNPSGGECRRFPVPNASAEACSTPECLHSPEIEPGGEYQTRDHGRLETPGAPEVMRSEWLSVVSKGGRSRKNGSSGNSGEYSAVLSAWTAHSASSVPYH